MERKEEEVSQAPVVHTCNPKVLETRKSESEVSPGK
jgi:hypothetical protein